MAAVRCSTRFSAMEVYKDELTTTELLSYKEILYDEATEEWYAQRDQYDVECEERECMRLAALFCIYTKKYRERLFAHEKQAEWSMLEHIESYCRLCSDQFKINIESLTVSFPDDYEELVWITWLRDYMRDDKWNISLKAILKSIHDNCT